MKMTRIVSTAAILCSVLLIHLLASDGERARSSGESLSIAALDTKEEIVVETLFSHRGATGRKYQIRRVGDTLTVAISDTTPKWAREDEMEGPIMLLTRPLSPAEAEGLDETIGYCRRVREELSSATKSMHLRYFRNGKQIGEELYIGFSLPSLLAYYESKGMRTDPGYEYDYQKLSAEYGVSLERIYRMVPFETLERKKTAESSEPVR